MGHLYTLLDEMRLDEMAINRKKANLISRQRRARLWQEEGGKCPPPLNETIVNIIEQHNQLSPFLVGL